MNSRTFNKARTRQCFTKFIHSRTPSSKTGIPRTLKEICYNRSSINTKEIKYQIIWFFISQILSSHEFVIREVDCTCNLQLTPVGYKNSSTSQQGRYWTACAGELAHSTLENIWEGTASLNSHLELEEEDDPFNGCDVEAERTRLSLTLSGNNFVHVLIFEATVVPHSPLQTWDWRRCLLNWTLQWACSRKSPTPTSMGCCACSPQLKN